MLKTISVSLRPATLKYDKERMRAMVYKRTHVSQVWPKKRSFLRARQRILLESKMVHEGSTVRPVAVEPPKYYAGLLGEDCHRWWKSMPEAKVTCASGMIRPTGRPPALATEGMAPTFDGAAKNILDVVSPHARDSRAAEVQQAQSLVSRLVQRARGTRSRRASRASKRPARLGSETGIPYRVRRAYPVDSTGGPVTGELEVSREQPAGVPPTKISRVRDLIGFWEGMSD